MHAKNKIGPFIATLICLNSMVGAGLFINPKPLTIIAGPLGFAGYILAAIVLLPIIYCTAELASLHPVSGGIYVFGRSYLGPVFGFLSCWSYFVGKTSSAALMAHKFMEFLQGAIPALANVPILLCDFALIFLLIGFNLAGVFIGGRSQYIFTAMRIIPLLAAFAVGFSLFNGDNFEVVFTDLGNVFLSLPIAVFAFLGFEMICAVGHLIQDSKQNIKKVILTSFGIVATLSVLFQLAVFGVLGLSLQTIDSPLTNLFEFALPANPFLGSCFGAMVFVAILGTCFGILTSNCWNLFTLANNNHLPFKSFLTRVSANNVPWGSLLTHGIISCTFLAVTTDQISLQNMTVFAQVISYLFTTVAALSAVRWFKATAMPAWIPQLGITSSLCVLVLALLRIINSGVSFSFAAILLIGIVSMFIRRYLKIA